VTTDPIDDEHTEGKENPAAQLRNTEDILDFG
jgi:hypothetical protein